MNDRNTQVLITMYPELYARCKYFECGDGWFEIINDLSHTLMGMNRRMDAHFDESIVSQVKEKYGGLRFYMSCATEEMHEAIEVTERLSKRTCEDCGGFGSIRAGAWIRTLCDECNGGKETPHDYGAPR